MRRRALALAVLLALLAGCGEQSRIDPNATVTISGVLHNPDGSPLAGRPVRLGAGVSVGDATLAVLTLGLACTGGICHGRVEDGSTDATGSYRFTLKGKQTQSSFGEAESELLTGSAPPAPTAVSGASISARFLVQTEKLRLPDLTLVDPSLSLQGRGTAAVASWSTRRSGPYTVSFEGSSPTSVWQSTTSGSPLAVDGRLLEDTAGRVVVSGQARDAVVGSDLDITWRSPGIAYVAGDGPPPSRGRPCSYDLPGHPAVRGACPWTDGDLTSEVPASVPCRATPSPPPGCAARPAVIVDLGGVTPVQLVVVRGCTDGCAVAVSRDAQTFVPAGEVFDEFGAVRLNGSPERFVRVRLGTQGLREISVWGPARAPALKPVDSAGQQRLARPYQLQQQGKDRPGWPIVALAVALLIAVAVALGYVLGRRRTAP